MDLLEKKAYIEKNLKFLPEEEKSAFEFNFNCVFTKNSVGMESGHTAKLEEVVTVVRGNNANNLDEGLKRDIYNHYACIEIIRKKAPNSNGVISEELVKDLHANLVNGIFQGGLYRQVNISVNGSRYTPCDFIKVYDRMKKYEEDTNAINDPIDKAVWAHLQLSKIHPFLDYNGRVCRLILNYVLIGEGFLPISIPAARRNEYFATLEIFKLEKNPLPFKEFLIDLLNKEYDRLIELVTPFVK